MKQHLKKFVALSLLSTVSAHLYAQELSQKDLQLFGNAQLTVAFVGAGSNDLASTVVHLPDGYTTVKAVGFDGTRLEVVD